MINKVFLSAVIVFSSSAMASNVKWDEASIAYETFETDSTEATGVSLAVTKVVENDIFLRARYSDLSGEEKSDPDFQSAVVKEERELLSLGIGYKKTVAQSTDFFGVLSYEKVDGTETAQFSSESFSTNGYGIELGVRGVLAERVELSGSIFRLDFEDAFTGYNVGASYYFTEQFSAGISLINSDELDRTRFTLIYNY